MKVVFTIELLHELRTARQWYNRRMPGSGERLVDFVDEKIGEIADAPASFRATARTQLPGARASRSIRIS